MRTLLIALITLTSLNAFAATSEVTQSELKLRGCLSLVYSNAAGFKGAAKDVTKMVSEGTRACRAATKELAKKERETKKKLKLEAQIAKLQAKLKGYY